MPLASTRMWTVELDTNMNNTCSILQQNLTEFKSDDYSQLSAEQILL